MVLIAKTKISSQDIGLQHHKKTNKYSSKIFTWMVNKAVFAYDTQRQIEKLVAEKISKKVEAYADTIAEKVTTSLGS